MKAFPREIEVRNLNERHIGVENELRVTVPQTTSSGCGDPNCCPPQPQQGASVFEKMKASLEKRGFLQSIGFDGGGREFRTNPISVKSLYQKRGKKYLTEYYEFLKPVTEVVDTGGTHIHISILPKDNPNMELNATALGMAFFKQFQKIAGRDTHWARNFAERTGCKNIEEMKEVFERNKYPDYDRAYFLKGAILSPTRHQTLEFRGPKGSNSAEEILAWVDFLKQVVKIANRNSVDGVEFKELLVGERIAEYVKNLPPERQITEAELSTKVNVMALA